MFGDKLLCTLLMFTGMHGSGDDDPIVCRRVRRSCRVAKVQDTGRVTVGFDLLRQRSGNPRGLAFAGGIGNQYL